MWLPLPPSVLPYNGSAAAVPVAGRAPAVVLPLWR